MATVSAVYGRRVMVSDRSCADSSTCCIGYEAEGSGTDLPQWRTTVFAFTVGSISTGLDVNIALAKVSGSSDALIYGKILPASSYTVESASIALAGTSDGTYLGTIPASGGDWSSGYSATGRVLCDGFTMSPGVTYYLILFSSLSSGYNCGYYSTDYSTTLTDYLGGLVRIYTGSGGDNGWHQAIPYVYTGSGGTNGWHQAMPYVYTGSGGTNGWHIAN